MVFMATKTKNKKKTPAKWSAEDRQAFADGNILRSHKVPNKKRVAAKRACRGRTSAD
jgi:hypothetical protein